VNAQPALQRFRDIARILPGLQCIGPIANREAGAAQHDPALRLQTLPVGSKVELGNGLLHIARRKSLRPEAAPIGFRRGCQAEWERTIQDQAQGEYAERQAQDPQQAQARRMVHRLNYSRKSHGYNMEIGELRRA
jgi:hypothetical protein